MDTKLISALLVDCIVAFGTAHANSALESALLDFRTYCITSHHGIVNMVENHHFSSSTYDDAPFTNAVAAISNNWQMVIDDWDNFGTNSEMAIIIPHLAGFAGTEAFLGLWNAMLNIHEEDSTRCPRIFIEEIHCPSGTPLEYYPHKNYKSGNVSNLLLRTKAAISTTNAWNEAYFRSIFSGEYKAEIEFNENWEKVSFEYAMEQLTNSVPHQQ